MNIQKTITVLLLLSYSLTMNGQSLDNFKTEDINGKTVMIPQSIKGKKSIIFLAFSQNAADQLEDWYEPVYVMFIDKEGMNSMIYDCNVKVILMFSGLNQAVLEKVKAQIKENADEELASFLLFYSGDSKDQREALGIEKKDGLYLAVLDEKGAVIAVENGTYSEDKLDRISDLVEFQE